MCYSSCFIQATREALVQNRLMQCRTCGSQAFHVQDCCRNPDYTPVATSQVGAALKRWIHGLWSHLRRPQRRQPQPVQQVSPARLDAWETRPLLTLDGEGPGRIPISETHGATEAEMHETVAAGR